MKTYAGNDLLDALFVTLHVKEGPDLAEGEVLAVSEGDKLVKGTKQLVGIAKDLALVEGPAGARNDLGEKVERVNVLKNVGLAVGDEHHVELVEGLVDESDVVLLNRRVLGAALGQLGERREKSLNARPRHLAELAGQNGLPATGADRSREDDLYAGTRTSVSQQHRHCCVGRRG